ncbi:hypothetical protein [Holospora undulata]|uniref:Uncharacterized protein n=1 Tax=Holospora undulata HU1 TaxID=1321371 RepID=A0A061JG76_9PROT|nr:hypothetical protein [Holospora undulata]ETZ04946.1 hypothetical protein K737_300641 [Holospora undulata HU1]
MKTLKHTTAKASYYNTRAECYDEFNENNSKAINALLEKILKEHQVATVLDLTCGTGSQVFWLQEKGFELTKIVPDNYLLTYSLIQDKTRATRRSTLWRRVNGDWKILYHQGTLIEEGSA